MTDRIVFKSFRSRVTRYRIIFLVVSRRVRIEHAIPPETDAHMIRDDGRLEGMVSSMIWILVRGCIFFFSFLTIERLRCRVQEAFSVSGGDDDGGGWLYGMFARTSWAWRTRQIWYGM